VLVALGHPPTVEGEPSMPTSWTDRRRFVVVVRPPRSPRARCAGAESGRGPTGDGTETTTRWRRLPAMDSTRMNHAAAWTGTRRVLRPRRQPVDAAAAISPQWTDSSHRCLDRPRPVHLGWHECSTPRCAWTAPATPPP